MIAAIFIAAIDNEKKYLIDNILALLVSENNAFAKILFNYNCRHKSVTFLLY